jgi:hypothetical protein
LLVVATVSLGLAAIAAANAQLPLAYAGYSVLAWLVIGLIFVGPLSWTYAFLTVLLLLGHWYKHSVHLVFDYPFVEPTGRFNNSEEQWAIYYLMASAGFLGIGLSRAAWVGFALLFPRRSAPPASTGRPAVVSMTTWVALSILVAVVYGINAVGGFFMVGVRPSIILPFGLNAPIAYMVFVGLPLFTSCIIAQDVAARRYLATPAFLFMCVESFIGSLSMASRGAIVIHLIPMLVASMMLERRYGVRRRSFAKLGLAAASLALVLVTVAMYRIVLYYGGVWSDSALLTKLAGENAQLFIDRWIGLEAMLVAVSEPQRSFELFWDFIVEDPTVGVLGLYQQLSGSFYQVLDGRTYLTLPGFMGILGMSGSAVMVGLGSAVVILALQVTERVLVLIFRGSVIPVALASGALAYSFFQMSYPRLIIPFAIQLLGSSVVFAFVTRNRLAGSHVPEPAPGGTAPRPAREAR